MTNEGGFSLAKIVVLNSLCETTQTELHHLVFVDIYVDRAKRVTNTLAFGGVVRHEHVLLSNVVQLLSELKLTCRCTCGKNLLEILPRLFRRLGFSNVVKHVIVDTCCQASKSIVIPIITYSYILSYVIHFTLVMEFLSFT